MLVYFACYIDLLITNAVGEDQEEKIFSLGNFSRSAVIIRSRCVWSENKQSGGDIWYERSLNLLQQNNRQSEDQ
jgi:hypothetical protein